MIQDCYNLCNLHRSPRCTSVLAMALVESVVFLMESEWTPEGVKEGTLAESDSLERYNQSKPAECK